MSLPVRVAVFGSCLTRDVFNRQFSPHYRDLFDCVVLANQTSVISVMSAPIDPAGADLSGIDERAQAEIRQELTRSFLSGVAQEQPDYLIVDWFADIHFGCSVLDDGVVTRNRWKILKTPYFQQTWQADLPPRGREYRERWRDATQRFVAEVRACSPQTRIVLHAARNATAVRGDDGEISPLPGAERLERMNRRWRRLNAEFAPLADAVIDVFTDDTVTYTAHPWGPMAVHYEMTYHAAFLSKLSALALADAREAATAARTRRSGRGSVIGQLRDRPRLLSWSRGRSRRREAL